MPSLNEIFLHRECYLNDALAQLMIKRRALISWDYQIDYRIVRLNKIRDRYGDPIFFTDLPLFPLVGWGSGWEGMAPLIFSLACEGLSVIPFSLPGTGNSKNPPWNFFAKNFFQRAAESILLFCDHLGISRANFLGHSMGNEVLAEVAAIRPELVNKVVMLCPSGMDKYNWFSKWGLAYSFLASGHNIRKEYQKLMETSGEQEYLQPMIDLSSKQKSAFFGIKRLVQRLYEFGAICKDDLSMTMNAIKENCGRFSQIKPPEIVFIGGKDDSVFPADLHLKSLWEMADLLPKFQGTVLAGIPHNPTLFHPEIAAAAIAHFLEE